jgi:Double zinc ribbon
MKCPRCQQNHPRDQKFCGECGTPLQPLGAIAQPAASYADLQHSLNEALQRQTAMSEILGVISNSPTDLQPVMAAIVETAARLADAEHAMIGRAEGNIIRWLAPTGPHRPRRQGSRSPGACPRVALFWTVRRPRSRTLRMWRTSFPRL